MLFPRIPPAFVMLFSFSKFTSYFSGRIASDERVVLFPTVGRHFNTTHYEIPVHGWIFEPESDSSKRRAFLAMLRKAFNVSREDKAVLKRRAQPFLVDNERWKRPRVRISERRSPRGKADVLHKMPSSSKNGHFGDVLVVPKDELHLSGVDSVITLEIDAADERRFRGCVHVLDHDGVSVISDIDDTIKISNVTSTKNLLRNTFLEEFKPVPGMSQIYSKWKEERGASFHFVSSSPWQLYEEIQEFCQREGFPDATFHLKSIRPKDKSILNLFKDPRLTKIEQIAPLMDRFPRRKFILVGDSGEKDPEVYGEIARKYADQVAVICIRHVGEAPIDDARMEAAFSGVPRDKWTVFVDATTIKDLPDSIDEKIKMG